MIKYFPALSLVIAILALPDVPPLLLISVTPIDSRLLSSQSVLMTESWYTDIGFRSVNNQ